MCGVYWKQPTMIVLNGEEGNTPVFLSIPIFFTVLDFTCFEFSLVVPKTLGEFCTDVIETPSKHFKPKLILFAECLKFNWHRQELGKNLAHVVFALMCLVSSCNFGAFLIDALWHPYVCGFPSPLSQMAVITKEFQCYVSLQYCIGFGICLYRHQADIAPFWLNRRCCSKTLCSRRGNAKFISKIKFIDNLKRIFFLQKKITVQSSIHF